MNRKGITYPALLAVAVGAAAAAGLFLNHFYPLSWDGVLPAAGEKPASSVRAVSPAAPDVRRASGASSAVPAGAKRIPAQVYGQNKPTDTWADVFYGDEKLALLTQRRSPAVPAAHRARSTARILNGRSGGRNLPARTAGKLLLRRSLLPSPAIPPPEGASYLLPGGGTTLGRVLRGWCPCKRWIATVNSQNFSEAARLLSRFKDE